MTHSSCEIFLWQVVYNAPGSTTSQMLTADMYNYPTTMCPGLSSSVDKSNLWTMERLWMTGHECSDTVMYSSFLIWENARWSWLVKIVYALNNLCFVVGAAPHTIHPLCHVMRKWMIIWCIGECIIWHRSSCMHLCFISKKTKTTGLEALHFTKLM